MKIESPGEKDQHIKIVLGEQWWQRRQRLIAELFHEGIQISEMPFNQQAWNNPKLDAFKENTQKTLLLTFFESLTISTPETVRALFPPDPSDPTAEVEMEQRLSTMDLNFLLGFADSEQKQAPWKEDSVIQDDSKILLLRMGNAEVEIQKGSGQNHFGVLRPAAISEIA